MQGKMTILPLDQAKTDLELLQKVALSRLNKIPENYEEVRAFEFANSILEGLECAEMAMGAALLTLQSDAAQKETFLNLDKLDELMKTLEATYNELQLRNWQFHQSLEKMNFREHDPEKIGYIPTITDASDYQQSELDRNHWPPEDDELEDSEPPAPRM